jgi:hypothetical protein
MVALAALGGQAAADGAFPDSSQILLPATRPHRIILVTNFGLVISEDDGATWEWACEPRSDDSTILYQQAAAPSDRIFAVLINNGLVYSDDQACTWTRSGGSLATANARDAFADPTNPARVFVVGAQPAAHILPSSVYRSDDAGLTFGPELDTAPVGGDMLGVESSASDPGTVYLAMYGTMGAVPGLLEPLLGHSSDGGAHWTASTLAPSLGANSFRIIAVDPTNPLRLFLRVVESFGEKVAVSSDGGQSFTEPVAVNEQFTAFVRLPSGTLLLGGSNGGKGVAFRSTDGGASFQPIPLPPADASGKQPAAPHLRALAERNGKLYGAADNFIDGFALGVSSDEGVSFQPLLIFNQVKRIKPCLQETCRDLCDNTLVPLNLWPAQVCGDPPSLPEPPPAKGKSGCGCNTAPQPALPAGCLLELAALGLLTLRRRPLKRRPQLPN